MCWHFAPASARLSGAEMDALEAYLRRIGTLSPAREHELASMVAPMFAQRLGVGYRDAVRFLAALFVRAGGHVVVPQAPARSVFRGRRSA